MEVSNAFCAKLGCKYPIIQASMPHIAGPELVSAVSLAGGFGMYSLSLSPKVTLQTITKDLTALSQACKGKPFGVDLCGTLDGSVVAPKSIPPEVLELFVKCNVRAVCLPAQASVMAKQCKTRSILVGCAVHTVKEAQLCQEQATADFVIAMGAEGGGKAGPVFISVLLPQIVDAVKTLPVVASGGVFDGRGLASALCYGASAVWVGTRFLLTPESRASKEYKNALLAATSDDTMMASCFTGFPLRVLRTKYASQFEANPQLLQFDVSRNAKDKVFELLQGGATAVADTHAIVSGQEAGAIYALMPAQDVVRDMASVATATLTLMSAKYCRAETNSVYTPICAKLGIKVPVFSAGMGGIAGKDMTATVSKAGGFGTFGSALDVANLGPDELLKQIQDINTMCEGTPFGVDILVHGEDGGVMPQLIDAFAQGGAKVFISGKGNPAARVVQMFHDRNMLVGSICGKLSHAKSAVRAGLDFVIVQGCEGGGHTGQVALSVLLPQVVDEVGDKVMVLAAGGIYDGRGLASALCYGAQGVWVGTRFMLSPEGQTSEEYKSRLMTFASEDTIVTKAYTGATMRVIRNPYVSKYADHPELLEPNSALVGKRAWNDGVWKLHSGAGVGDPKVFDINNQALVTGQNVGAIDTLKPCKEIVEEMNATCFRVLRALANGKAGL